MKQIKKMAALVTCFAMVITFAPNASLAAKAPKLSKKTVSVKVGKTAAVKVKNTKKKAKVTWKIKNKKIAKITKKSKTSCTIKGTKAGSTKLTCTVKTSGKPKTLTCTVQVKKASVSQNTTGTRPVPTDNNPAPQLPIATPTPAVPSSPTPIPKMTPAPLYENSTWITTWGTAEEKCDITKNAMPQLDLEGTTVRQIVRVTTTGRSIRLRLSNQYGTTPVTIKSMHVAKQVDATKSRIDLTTDTVITVDGKEEFTIPAGKIIQTDSVDFSIQALDNIAISCYFGKAPKTNITGHRGARATTYQIAGNQVSSEIFSSERKTTTSWFFLADVSLESPEGSKAVVCFGDSITDGYGTDASYLNKKPDSYTRWGDYFAKRLQNNEKTKRVSVINEGIGSNSILGSYPTDAGKDRFSRDLLQHDGVAYCIILFGVNDLDKLQNTNKFSSLKKEYEKMIKLCHDNNIKVYAAPILPFGTSTYYSDASEQVRTLINDWFRSNESNVDGIIDFESAVADPKNPKNLLKEYTHDDGLHPYDGYSAMADAIDLSLFE